MQSLFRNYISNYIKEIEKWTVLVNQKDSSKNKEVQRFTWSITL